jgi:hypothetical protein
VAGRARGTETRTGETGTPQQSAGTADAGRSSELADEVRPARPAEGRFEGRRSATVNLPFVTAQFRVPDVHPPSLEELGWAVDGARSILPSGKSMMFFGGLAATAIAGVIEWPVAAAIGVGTALASKGGTDPEPRGGTPRAVQTGTTGASEGTTSSTSGAGDTRA